MPTLYITGNNDAGRSCIVEKRALSAGEAAVIPFAAAGPLPELVKCRTDAKLLKSHSEPGTYRTVIYPWRPGMYTDAHRTISIDVNAILDGSIILELEEDKVTLVKGDVVVLPGTVHVWRATDETALVFYTIQAAKWSEDDLAEETYESQAIIHGG